YDRVQREVKSQLSGRLPTVEDLSRLPFSLAVIKEALRMYPPAYILARRATRAVSVGGHPVEPGQMVVINIIGMQRRPDLFSNPDEFRPDRFMGAAEQSLPKGAYLPFGAGPRVCIGTPFAMMEAQLILAILASRGRFVPTTSGPIEPDPQITLRIRGLRMQLRREA